MKNENKDMVKKPNHYTSLYSIECKDLNIYLDPWLSNVLKYIYRWDFKGVPDQDLRKANEYLNYFVEFKNKVPGIKLSKQQRIDLDYMLEIIAAEAELKNDNDRFLAIRSIFNLSEMNNILINNDNAGSLDFLNEKLINSVYDISLNTIRNYIENNRNSLKEV